MSQERFRSAKRIFVEALALPPAQRPAYIQIAADGDADLAAEVEHLLAVQLTQINVSSDVQIAPGALSGFSGYKILSEIGRGGMGVVYLAERSFGGVQQRVALKRMLPGFPGTAQDVQRFHGERQILAALDHPHIARLVDAGTAEDGSPFFAMEYVEGVRIDQYVRTQALDVQQCVQLIIKIARAVASAHRHLVVHRDLKPGNILVDAYGEPKLLDFGIAKLLDASPIERQHAATTVGGAQMLTPLYAAPEQVRCEPVSTATDVYALGVVMYELTTGVSPYGKLATASPHFLSHAICEEDPTAPSLAVARGVGNERTVRTAQRLRGDLDAVVLKCLRKRPEDRYASMDALAADLDAWAADEPVAARRGNRWYRWRRFARRHWAAVGTALLFVLLSVAFVLSLERELGETQRERDRAEAERERAERVTEFIAKVFGEADPKRAKGEALTVRQALDRGYERIHGEELAEQPLTRSQLLREISSIYGNLGEKDKSLAAAEEAIALLEPRADTAGVDLARARIAAATAHFERDELDQAEAQLAAAIQGAVQADEGGLVLSALNVSGRVAQARGKHADAVAIYQRIERQTLARLNVQTVEQASRLPIRAYNRREIASLANNASNLCIATRELGKAREALALCQPAMRLKQALYDLDSPALLTTAIEIAILQDMLGDTEASIAANREILALSQRIYGKDHVRSAFPMVNLALDLGKLQQFDEAKPLLREAVAIFKNRLGEQHQWYQTALRNLGGLELKSGDAATALQIQQQVLALQQGAAMPENQDSIARTWGEIAQAQEKLGQKAQALGSARTAFAIFTEALGDAHPSTLEAQVQVARLMVANGEAAAAVELAERAFVKIPGDEDSLELRSNAQLVLAQALWDGGGDRKRALELAQSALVGAKTLKHDEELVDEVEAWLAAHRPG